MGFEPTAYRLKADYSTIELRTHINFLSHLSQSDFIRLQLLSLSYIYIYIYYNKNFLKCQIIFVIAVPGSRTQYLTGYEPGMVFPSHLPAIVIQHIIELLQLGGYMCNFCYGILHSRRASP